jgi:hypothetical protein
VHRPAGADAALDIGVHEEQERVGVGRDVEIAPRPAPPSKPLSSPPSGVEPARAAQAPARHCRPDAQSPSVRHWLVMPGVQPRMATVSIVLA